jgi:oligopeptide transport system substrate-binding protein
VQASATADNRERLELFQRAEAILLGEAPLIPLYFRSQVYAIRPEVRGWTTTVVGFHDWNRIWLQR